MSAASLSVVGGGSDNGLSAEKIANANDQVRGIFEYFLEKLCSEKQSFQTGALRIFNRLFLSSLPLTYHNLTGVDEQLLNQLSANTIDLNELIGAFKKQTGAAYDCVRELLVKYFRRAIVVETNLDYLNVYMSFLLDHLPQQQTDDPMTDDGNKEKACSSFLNLFVY